MDITEASDDELVAEIAAMKLALGVPLGQPYDGREERKNADLPKQIEAMQAELDRRRAYRT